MKSTVTNLENIEERSISSSNDTTIMDGDASKSAFGFRHLMAALLFLACTVGYAMRIDMSIAIVAMTDNSTNENFEHFDWSMQTQTTILSSFFWGYVITQVPSGLVAQKLGVKWLLFSGILINSVTAMLTPVATGGGWGAVCAIRVIQGLTQATLFPSIHATLSKWAPPDERARLASIAFAGAQAGTIIALPLSGFLATSSGGWPSIFYVIGALGLAWCILWAALSSSTPDQHRCISQNEVKYIQSFWGPAISLVALAYIPADQPTSAVALLVLAVGLNAGVYVGFQVNHIDLSPNYAGTMMGITNCLANILSIIAPLAVGQIVTETGPESQWQWRIVFWIAAVIYTIGNIFYLWLGSADKQLWDDPTFAKANKKVKNQVVEIETGTK